MKKWIVVFLCLTLLFSLCSCGAPEITPPPTETTKEEVILGEVGICLPGQTDQRWVNEGETLKQKLKALGYQVFIEYGQEDAYLQADQVKMLLAKPVDCLVVAAVDSIALSSILEQAQQANIPVIAYDRLVMHSASVAGYVGFDYENIGIDIANRVIEEKALTTAQAEGRSHTIEFFMGDYRNANAIVFYESVMQELQSYLDSGVLICNSGRRKFEDTCVENSDRELARQRCEDYKGQWPEILLCAEDSLADGCADALKSAADPLGNWPLITGQNAYPEAAARVAQGQQLLTVYYDTGVLVQACADAVVAVLAGETFGQSACNNGVVDVPADLYTPEIVDMGNYEELLVDSGIYTREELVG